MFVKTNKTQLNVCNSPKRQFEENDRNRVNSSDTHNWLQNSFNDNNNKRSKTDNRWTPMQSQTNGLMSRNSTISSQDVMDDENGLNDGMDDLISQFVDTHCSQSTSENSANTSEPMTDRISDQNMTTQITVVKSDEDMSGCEASEGRLKILESRNRKLNEEMLRTKTQNIQFQHKIRELELQNQTNVSQMTYNFDSFIKFKSTEKETQEGLIESLQTQLRHYAPNSEILKRSEEYLSQRKRNASQNFSQIILKEFYAPLSVSPTVASMQTISSQNTPFDSGEVLVPESQNSSAIKRPKLSSGFPSQICSTQLTSVSCSLPQPMDTYSGPSTESTIRGSNGSQTQSQTQSSKMIWNTIRAVLEHKFSTNQNQLKQFYFNSEKVRLFPDQWIPDNKEINDLTTGLNQLVNELDLNIQPIIR